ncbi:hypothetical protein ACFX2I_035968 [Malus domestica]
MGPRRSTRLNVIIGAAPSLRGSTMATTAVATTVTTTRGKVHGTATTPRAVPSKAHGHGPSHVTPSPTRTQRVAKPSLSLAPMCITLRATHFRGPACSRRAAHSHGPTCSNQATHSRSPACFRRAAHSHGPAGSN